MQEVEQRMGAVAEGRGRLEGWKRHGIPFWDYLKDRVSGKNIIPPLTEYIRQAASSRM